MADQGKRPLKRLRSIRLKPNFDEELLRASYWCKTKITRIFEQGASIVLKRLRKQFEAEHPGMKAFPPVPPEVLRKKNGRKRKKA